MVPIDAKEKAKENEGKEEKEPVPKDPEEPPDDPVFPAPPAGCHCPPYLPCSAISDLCIKPNNTATGKPNGGGGGTGGKPTEAGTGVTAAS